MSVVAPKSPAAATAPKGQREVDQVRQIGSSHGGKVLARQLSGVRHHITINLSMDADSPQLSAMLRAIEFAIRGQFDRGRRLQGMTQFVAKSRLIDVQIRCLD